jgi:thioredoxin 1
MSINLNDQNFEREIASASNLALVDFFATWCEPCNIMAPILEKVSDDLKDKIVLFKVNVDEAPIVSGKFGVEKIPTMVLFKDGKAISNFVGMAPEESVKKWIEGF